MHCSYCYYLEKGRFSSHEVQTVMSEDLLEKMIKETVAASLGPTVSFVWHGGEPTLAGIPFFRKALQLERRHLKPGWNAWNNLQTNGLLLDDEWAAFLKRHNFDVGLSIDGTEAVHDTNRKDLGGHDTFERVRNAVKVLKKAGISPDLLCTVNAETVKDPEGVYRVLRDLNTGWIQFIPILVPEKDGPVVSESQPEVHLSKESITPEQYGEFLCRVFDEWITNDIGRTDVQLFAEMAHVLTGEKASLCWMAETCGRVLIAEEDGAIYSCDHFVDDEHRIGNLQDASLEEIADREEQVQFGQAKKTALTEECKACPFLQICNGACPKDRYGVSETGQPGQYYLCKGLKKFFNHAVTPMVRVMGWTKDGMEPEKVMRRVRRLL